MINKLLAKKRVSVNYRHLPAWLLVGLCVPLLFIDLEYFSDFPLLLMCWNLGHLVLFGLLSWLALRYWPARYARSPSVKLLLLLMFALLIGGAVEAVQSLIGRMASVDDMIKNVTGVMTGFVIYSWRHDKFKPCLLALLTFLAVILLLWEVKPIATNSYNHYLSWRDFPLLSDFEEPVQLRRWEGTAARSIVSDVHHQGNHWLRVEFTGRDKWSTLNLSDFPRDWRDRQLLAFDIYNPSSKSQKIYSKIYDHLHRGRGQFHNDRFNRLFILLPGLNHLQIDINAIIHAPAERLIDISRIEHAGFFMANISEPVVIYVDNVRLQ